MVLLCSPTADPVGCPNLQPTGNLYCKTAKYKSRGKKETLLGGGRVINSEGGYGPIGGGGWVSEGGGDTRGARERRAGSSRLRRSSRGSSRDRRNRNWGGRRRSAPRQPRRVRLGLAALDPRPHPASCIRGSSPQQRQQRWQRQQRRGRSGARCGS